MNLPGGLGQRGVFICDHESKNIYANSAYHEMTGSEPGELLGLGWISFVHPDDLPSVWALAFGHFSQSTHEDRQIMLKFVKWQLWIGR